MARPDRFVRSRADLTVKKWVRVLLDEKPRLCSTSKMASDTVAALTALSPLVAPLVAAGSDEEAGPPRKRRRALRRCLKIEGRDRSDKSETARR